MKPANTKKFIKNLQKEIYKLDIQIGLIKTDMNINKSLGNENDYKK